MPNWCNNSITIEGPADKIRALWDAANPNSEYAGLLEAMVPIGEWDYDTAVSKWGTKWDVNGEGLDFELLPDGRAQITGWADSAWAPPQAAFQTYAGLNEGVYLELRYFEPGMSFVGVWDSEGGDDYWDNVGDLLDTTEEEDAVLYELLGYFDVWDWYETDEDDEENLEIDLDGGLSAINE
jgi:hypothetical protein